MKTKEELKQIAHRLPEEPGIYTFFDQNNKIIYVGKAKQLKRRVLSYFLSKQTTHKTEVLIRNIWRFEYIVVESEQDALILENNLIKKYQPRYNILLKDDKTFPWICVKNESFPRVFSTRKMIQDGSIYFGPYTSGLMVKTLIDLFRQTYKIRTCNYPLTKENVSRGKFKVCLQFHLDNCKGPCVGKQNENEYAVGIDEIIAVLKGNIQSVLKKLKEQMERHSKDLNFEEALKYKMKMELLQKYQAHSKVVSNRIDNIDVYSLKRDGNFVYVNFLKIANGSVIHSFTQELQTRLDESDEELLLFGITEIRQKIPSTALEIVVPFKPSFQLTQIKYTVPQRGDKKNLLELSQKNLTHFILEKKKAQLTHLREKRSDRILQTVQKDLCLSHLPIQIECFDNSNLQGTNPVASCVVFRNATPSKRDYRHFSIKTVQGPNDFASMEEIVFRRYKRILDENSTLPNLIIVDGGKGQLNAALKALEKLNIRGKIPIIGIAKRLEEIYYPDDPIPLYIDKNSETLRLIQNLRDEAHRFGITHHRGKRLKEMSFSELDALRGIGTKTKEKLLNEFQSVERIKQAKLEELIKVVGKAKAEIIQSSFSK